MRRIERSSAHSRFTVAGASSAPRRDFVASRATRYSATRRVVIADTGASFPKNASSGTRRSSSSLIERQLGALLGQELLDHRAESDAGRWRGRLRQPQQPGRAARAFWASSSVHAALLTRS
jgi:hypothetical protein